MVSLKEELIALGRRGGPRKGDPMNISEVLDGPNPYGIRRWDDKTRGLVRILFSGLNLDIDKAAGLRSLDAYCVDKSKWHDFLRQAAPEYEQVGIEGLTTMDPFKGYEPLIVTTDLLDPFLVPAHEVAHADYNKNQPSVRAAISEFNGVERGHIAKGLRYMFGPTYYGFGRNGSEVVGRPMSLGLSRIVGYMDKEKIMKDVDYVTLSEAYAHLVERKLGFVRDYSDYPFENSGTSKDMPRYLDIVEGLDFLEARKMILGSNSREELERNASK